MNNKAMKDLIANTFARWGSDARPELSDEDVGKMLGISLGLGALFRESIEAEREWMQISNSRLKTRPLTMVLAGHFDEVLREVEHIRGLD